jgi:hypothetical protein
LLCTIPQVLMGRGDVEKASGVREEIHSMESEVQKMGERRGDRALEGCAVKITGAEGKLLAKSLIVRYDMKKNEVRLLDPVDNLASTIKAASDRAAQGTIKADQLEGMEQRPTYSIAWLDFLARAVPPSLAPALSPEHAQMVVEIGVRIPPSRNLKGQFLPYAPPSMVMQGAAGFLFPATGRQLQIRSASQGRGGWVGGPRDRMEILDVREEGKKVLVRGFCGGGSPTEGDVRVWDEAGEEWEGKFKEAEGVLPRERRGPLDFSELTIWTLPLALDVLPGMHPSKRESFLELCSSGMHPLQAADLSFAEQSYLLSHVPSCVLSQFGSEDVRFLRHWLPEDEIDALRKRGARLELLDRYTLQFIEVCLEGERSARSAVGEDAAPAKGLKLRSSLRRSSLKARDKKLSGLVPKNEKASDTLGMAVDAKAAMHTDLYEIILLGQVPTRYACMLIVMECQRRLIPSDGSGVDEEEEEEENEDQEEEEERKMTENESKTTSGLPISSDAQRGSWQDHEYFHPSAVKGFQLQNTPWRTSDGVIAMGGPGDDSSGIGCIAARIAWLNDTLPPSEFQLMTFPAIASAVCWFYIVEGIKRRAMSALRSIHVNDPSPHSSCLPCSLSSFPLLPPPPPHSYCMPFDQLVLLLV